MANYRVRWVIEAEASSPLEAADAAFEHMQSCVEHGEALFAVLETEKLVGFMVGKADRA